ncbi:MAG: metallopeptidase TldD-related protein [Pseudomonadota bacterium]
MTVPLSELTEKLLAAAKQAGADAADAMAVRGTSQSIEVRGGNLEQAERAEGTDIGLRVFLGLRSASVAASDLRDGAMYAMAEHAVAVAREAPEDPYAGLAAEDEIAKAFDAAPLELHDPSPEPSPSDLQGDATRAEAAAKGVAGVSQVESASAGYSAHDVHLSASNGFSGGYSRTDRGLYCVAISGTGTSMERDYDGDTRMHQSDLRSPDDIGQKAGERAAARAGATKPQTGRFPVLFDERVASSLIGHLLAATNGLSVARGASWLRDALGSDILPKQLSLHEDPHRPRASGSRPFDAEGLSTQPRDIVANGVLTGWTLDLATARKLGMRPTGNAGRGTSSTPAPTTWNVALTQGRQSQAELLSDMCTGLLVTSLIGSTINQNTGDYSRGASGFWVENGEITNPVNECTIAGNLRDMLLQIVPANDARTHLSRVVPSLLVPEMTLAGK